MSGTSFLLLSTRADDLAAAEEYASVLRFTGLPPERLVQVRAEAGTIGHLDVRDHAGVILGGSPFSVSDPTKTAVQRRVEAELLDLLDDVARYEVPFLGLCYGVGVLTTWAGGVVDGTYAEETSAVPVSLTADGLADPLLADLPPTFDAYVGHKEACTVLPDGAVLLASSPHCPVQMYRLGRHRYVTQFHPESDAASVATRTAVYRDAGYFPPEQVDAVLARVRAADVSASHHVLSAFARRYGGGPAVAVPSTPAARETAHSPSGRPLQPAV